MPGEENSALVHAVSAPWILLSAETRVGDQGTGAARGMLSDVESAFGGCEQTLIFDRRGA